MTIALIIFLVLLIIFTLAYFTTAYVQRPLSPEKATLKIQKLLDQLVAKNSMLSSALLTIDSENLGFRHFFSSGTGGNGRSIDATSQYHSASIGKTFTACLIHIHREKGYCSLEDPIVDYLDKDLLDDLFIYDNVDYQHMVTIGQLLNHTSGIADYFEDAVTHGSTMKELLINRPNQLWSPLDLINFTKVHQKAVGKPSEIFHYSDTGYLLLGLLLEAISGTSFDVLLDKHIFKPLQMTNSYLMFHSKSKITTDKELLPLYLWGTDLTKSKALSVDWSGGGIVTNTSDLLTFFKALHHGQLLSKESFDLMTTFDQTYDHGIYYGQGMMLFKLSQLSFLLKGMGDLYGGVGASGTYMLYDAKSKTYIMMNLGALGLVEKGIQVVVQIMMIYGRINSSS